MPGDNLDVQYKTAFVLAHKIREAMASELRGVVVGGDGAVVEVDGCYVGGHVRPENRKEDRKDRRLAANQNGQRRVVVVLRERLMEGTSHARTIVSVFPSEDDSLSFLKSRVEKASQVQADESAAWNALHARFDTRRVNHSVESRAEDGTTTTSPGSTCCATYAQETAWREDPRRESTGGPFRRVIVLVAANGPSVDFGGYWQRRRKAA